MAEDRKPWMKWYWSDWRANPELRSCGLSARGLWAEMLAIMSQADPYGHLLIAGNSLTPKQLANQVGGGVSVRDVETLLRELEDANTFSRTETGVIFSRRMIRDKAKADKDRENGKGGGNPKLNYGVNPPHNPSDKGVDKAQRPEARDQKPEEIPPGGSPIDAAVSAWNETAKRCELAVVQKITDARRTKLTARLRDCGGIDGWKAALAKVENNPFFRGQNDRGWKADFDFLLQEKSFTKLMEGGYDRRDSGSENGNPGGAHGRPTGRGPGENRPRTGSFLAAIARAADRFQGAVPGGPGPGVRGSVSESAGGAENRGPDAIDRCGDGADESSRNLDAAGQTEAADEITSRGRNGRGGGDGFAAGAADEIPGGRGAPRAGNPAERGHVLAELEGTSRPAGPAQPNAPEHRPGDQISRSEEPGTGQATDHARPTRGGHGQVPQPAPDSGRRGVIVDMEIPEFLRRSA